MRFASTHSSSCDGSLLSFSRAKTNITTSDVIRSLPEVFNIIRFTFLNFVPHRWTPLHMRSEWGLVLYFTHLHPCLPSSCSFDPHAGQPDCLCNPRQLSLWRRHSRLSSCKRWWVQLQLQSNVHCGKYVNDPNLFDEWIVWSFSTDLLHSTSLIHLQVGLAALAFKLKPFLSIVFFIMIQLVAISSF